ncbi:MAG: hypothetical protein O2890_12550 [Cyanobacteria bacterium]|nr:hypothetical protein [Cyanobacteriota bacterium]MDA0867219.1 hypothetical protein [Cyanobacteriota bacterium]
MSRFGGDRQTLADFQDQIWVRCPRCAAQARVYRVEPGPVDAFAPRRLACLHCGALKSWTARTIRYEPRDAVDPYFHCPLWLQTPCCGDVLWAYNRDHLDWLAAFVGADLRGRSADPQGGWVNRSLVSRLPGWMQAKHNREAILRAIGQLRSLSDASQ